MSLVTRDEAAVLAESKPNAGLVPRATRTNLYAGRDCAVSQQLTALKLNLDPDFHASRWADNFVVVNVPKKGDFSFIANAQASRYLDCLYKAVDTVQKSVPDIWELLAAQSKGFSHNANTLVFRKINAAHKARCEGPGGGACRHNGATFDWSYRAMQMIGSVGWGTFVDCAKTI